MILGVGMDLVGLSGFREQLADTASSFVEGTFTEREQAEARNRPGKDHQRHLAVRYAAKEAFIKAWSVSNWGQRPQLPFLDMREIEVVNDPFHRPQIELHGAIDEAMQKVQPYKIHLSLTHDEGYAGAVVVLEQVKEASNAAPNK